MGGRGEGKILTSEASFTETSTGFSAVASVAIVHGRNRQSGVVVGVAKPMVVVRWAGRWSHKWANTGSEVFTSGGGGLFVQELK